MLSNFAPGKRDDSKGGCSAVGATRWPWTQTRIAKSRAFHVNRWQKGKHMEHLACHGGVGLRAVLDELGTSVVSDKSQDRVGSG